MEEKHRAFTRFVVSIICNNCGLNGMAQLSWQPNEHLAAKCFRCGTAEIVFVGIDNAPKKLEPDVTLSPDEAEIVRELAEKRRKEREAN